MRTRSRAWSTNSCLFLLSAMLPCLAVFLGACASSPSEPLPIPDAVAVNVSHLDHLGQDVERGDTTYRIVHIYAEAPDYEWVGDEDEGIACVDDAARAAVAYLRHYEQTGEHTSREKAEALLRFVQYMQDDTGLFFNFVWDDSLRINRTHANSRADEVSWWTARAVWALGEGVRVLHEPAHELARSYSESIVRVMPHLQALLGRYGETATEDGRTLPQWLIHTTAADATSELLLGLTALHEAEPSDTLQAMIDRFAEGVAAMRYGSMNGFPYGGHASWRGGWHAWGNSQSEALVRAGRPASAVQEAEQFYSRLLVLGWLHSISYDQSTPIRRYEQIAYGVRPVVVGLLRLYEETEEPRYARMAGLAASWFTGNNVADTVMYDPATGRGYDGITGPESVNRNAGAESTIEALLTMLALQRHPEAAAWSVVQAGAPLAYEEDGKRYAARFFTAPQPERRLALTMNLTDEVLEVLEGDQARSLMEQHRAASLPDTSSQSQPIRR